jgi:hypothetical protein
VGKKGVRSQVPGARCQVSGARFQVSIPNQQTQIVAPSCGNYSLLPAVRISSTYT